MIRISTFFVFLMKMPQTGGICFFVYKKGGFCRKTFVFSLGKMRIHVGIDTEKLEKMLILRDS